VSKFVIKFVGKCDGGNAPLGHSCTSAVNQIEGNKGALQMQKFELKVNSVQEKHGDSKHAATDHDFKTLADVLIQGRNSPNSCQYFIRI
jgi:hypothetical protein